eukprot:g9096.t1
MKACFVHCVRRAALCEAGGPPMGRCRAGGVRGVALSLMRAIILRGGVREETSIAGAEVASEAKRDWERREDRMGTRHGGGTLVGGGGTSVFAVAFRGVA